MKLTVLVDNNTFIDEYYLGEPAVSYYIEDENTKILFDIDKGCFYGFGQVFDEFFFIQIVMILQPFYENCCNGFCIKSTPEFAVIGIYGDSVVFLCF